MFTKATLKFLDELAANNNRAWFDENRSRYEALVREPALDFIDAMSPALQSFAPHFRADLRKVGGSLMRVYRDTRFARDKTPYKTNIGIQFRHDAGKDVHAPGYYVHVEPGECFIGVGLWHPDADALFKIREAIAQKSDAWLAARNDEAFRTHFTLEGESLANAPRGFAKDHPLVDDLKRKDFIGMAQLAETTLTSTNLRTHVTERFRQAGPYMRFLCRALDLGF